MGVRITGLDSLQRKLSDLANRAERFHGEHKVSLADLLTPRFIRSCSRFSSADEFFRASGLRMENAEDFTSAEWEAHVRQNTRYGGWQETIRAASVQWSTGQLGL